MTDFYINSLTRFGGSHALELTQTRIEDAFDSQVTDLGGVVNRLHSDSTDCVIQSDRFVTLQPTSAVNPNLLNAGTVEFRTSRDVLSKIYYGYLKLTVTNSTGAAAQVAAGGLLLQQKTLYGNQGGKQLYQEEDLDIWFNNVLYSRIEWENMTYNNVNMFNSDAAYNPNGLSLANNASQNIYIPLVSFLMSSDLSLSGLKDDLFLRYQFKPSSLTVIAGALPSVTSCSLLLRGVTEPDTTIKRRMELYNSVPLTIKFLAPSRHRQNGMNLAPNSKYEFTLQGISGLVSYLFIVIRASAITAANQAVFINAIDTYDLVDQSGKSITGYYSRTADEARCLIYPESFDNNFNANSNFVFHPFSEYPLKSALSGNNYGHQPFDGFNKLQFTTKSTLTAGSYNVEVWARVYNHCYIRDGTLMPVN